MPKINIMFGIGYGGKALSFFLKTLLENKIEMLVDIRTFPMSRHFPQFGRKILSETLWRARIMYQWEGRRIGGKLPNVGFDACLDELADAAKRGKKILLMCAEADADKCHRNITLKPALAKRGIRLVEIRFHTSQRSGVSAPYRTVKKPQ